MCRKWRYANPSFAIGAGFADAGEVVGRSHGMAVVQTVEAVVDRQAQPVENLAVARTARQQRQHYLVAYAGKGFTSLPPFVDAAYAGALQPAEKAHDSGAYYIVQVGEGVEIVFLFQFRNKASESSEAYVVGFHIGPYDYKIVGAVDENRCH